MPTSDHAMIELPPDAATADDHRNPRRRRRSTEGNDAPQVGMLVHPEAHYDLDALVLHDGVRRDILAGLRAIQMREHLEAVWQISRLQPQQGRCILNFHGPPGTGKTRAALSVALRLGKPLYQIDYSAIISKYLGDTAKHLKLAFQQSREYDAVLFFDEADSLLSRRVDVNESCATSINQNRNVLMQELDQFDGVVIVTTNLFGNYDPALLRRIQRHIKFRLPDAAMRRELFALHLPNLARVEADLGALAAASLGLSGGDILNVCVNAIHAGSTDDNPVRWKITEPMLLREIRLARQTRAEHEGRSPARRRVIGFTPPPFGSLSPNINLNPATPSHP